MTATAIGLGVLSLGILGLGHAGWFNRTSAIALLAVGALLGLVTLVRSNFWRQRDTTGSAINEWLGAPAGWAWLWLAAMPFLAVAIVAALLPPGVMWPGEPNAYDVVEYHLQIPREWYEIGRIVPLGHNAFSYFPFNVEMHYLLAMHLRGGPWAGMYLAHFMHLAMVVLSVAAVHGFARRLASHPGAAHVASLAVATVPWLTQLGSIAYNEGGLLLYGTLATGWAFDAALTPARRLGRFPVAGLCAGFACGCKLTAVPEVLLAVGAIAAAVVLFTSRRRDQEVYVPLSYRLAGVAVLFIAGLLAFSPWLIRNQIWSGNPVFPEGAAVFGAGHFSQAQLERWHQAHSPRADQHGVAAHLKAWTSDVWLNPQFGYVLLPLGVVLGLAACVKFRESLHGIALIAMFVALSVVWLGFTHLQGRFFILGVPLAGLLLAHGLNWRSRLVAVAASMSATAVILIAAVIGFLIALHAPLMERLNGPNGPTTALLGFESMDEVFTPEAAREQVPADAPLALVGDARAFFYASRQGRLYYRTVFDIDAKPGDSAIEAWSRDVPPDAWLLVDPSEVARLSRTYRAIPPLPEKYRDRGEPFVIPPSER